MRLLVALAESYPEFIAHPQTEEMLKLTLYKCLETAAAGLTETMREMERYGKNNADVR